jgi:hypothetical protein
MNSNKITFSTKSILSLGILTASLALFAYIYLGTFTRYMADDYCLLISLNSGNIFAASWTKYLVSSNRFSNLFVLGFWELFGHRSIAYVPAFLTALWVGGLFWLFTEIKKVFEIKISPLFLFLAAELIALLTFYTAPNLFQSIYWRPGQLTYFTPIVLFTLLMAWLTRLSASCPAAPSGTSGTFATFGTFALFTFLAFFIGGLSETLGTLHIAALLLAILAVLLFDKTPRRKPALTLLIATLIGALAALIAMLFAPANALRIDADSPPPSIIEAILRALQFAVSFLISAFRVLPTSILATLIIFSLLSYLFFTQTDLPKPHPRFWLTFVIIPVITYGLIVAIVAPSAYGQSYPVERVRFPAHFVFILALASLSICAAYLVSHLKLPSFTRPLALAVLAVSLLYPLWIGKQSLSDVSYRQYWSSFWDEREQTIYDLRSQGQTDLMIPSMSGYQSTKELDVNEKFWVNICAAEYYGVNSIRAIPGPNQP